MSSAPPDGSSARRHWAPAATAPGSPAPAGAYTPVVRAGDFLFVSGQIPKVPQTGAIVGDDVTAQTTQVVRNIEAALQGAGASLADVVSTTVYLASPDDWGAFNAIYEKLMPPPYPARTTIGVSLRGILVEISAIAFLPSGS